MKSDRPFLLDVTRSLARAWTGRTPTGIDRVCNAYLQHYRLQAHAVIQHRGIFRVLTQGQSDALFALISTPGPDFRLHLIKLMATVLLSSALRNHIAGKYYLNVGHTDFDLPGHWRWIKWSNLRPFYMIHDLIPINHPNLTNAHAIRRHTARVEQALDKADGIIANSQSTVEDLRQFSAIRHLGMPPVVAAHLGVDDLANAMHRPVNAGGYFVSLGSIEKRKNHLLLLRVWQKLIVEYGENVPHLVIIGHWNKNENMVRDFLSSNRELARHVAVLNACEDAEMFDVIRSARAVLLPSMAEGYGLALAEAMALGVPVIASDLSSFREISDVIPLLIRSDDDLAWEAAIKEFLRTDAESHRQRTLLSGHQPRRWEKHFTQVDDWIADLAADRFAKHRSVPGPDAAPGSATFDLSEQSHFNGSARS